MPFVSEAQRKWMHANRPKMAAEWEAHTPKGKKLPDYSDPKHSHPFSFDPTGSGCLICGKPVGMHHIK